MRSQAVLMAIGINWEGRRSILAVELANRETTSSWKQLLLGLRQRCLQGVGLVISDDHAGLRKAIAEVLPEAVWQRCYVHFLRSALDYLPRKADDDCLMELRWIYDRRDLTRPGKISAPGWPNGASATLSSADGSRITSRKHSASTGCHGNTIRT